jgi:carbamoyl-phosphate synthase large subunit
MPKDHSLKKILVVGSGPIIIGQACEFDYSGTQAITTLKKEGIEVVLLNANPATIMTDPELADRTYIEPINVETAERIIAREKPDALLPTLGGQTALNLAKELAEKGILEKYGVRLIGASLEAINKAEDRLLFREAMEKIGVPSPKSVYSRTLEESVQALETVGLPAIIRPSFTLGGTGGGIAETREQFIEICKSGLIASPTSTLLIEESLVGWKEYELEVIRDKADNVIIVCSIENLDPMGVHTGDSITVAPAMTLADKEYQQLREYSKAIIREIGVDTGGSNVQFAVNPKDGRVVVIEMNPRVSRSSALASKATGYPIAKVAARLALGYTLDELRNEITGTTTACFEPALDYVVVKIPRFNFDKFPGTKPALTTSMRSVGEVMAMGRTFSEAFLKALRSMEQDRSPFAPVKGLGDLSATLKTAQIADRLEIPNPDRIAHIFEAYRLGWSIEQVQKATHIDLFYLRHMKKWIELESEVRALGGLGALGRDLLLHCKRTGISDIDLGAWLGCTESQVRSHRRSLGIRPVYKTVDTCAAEFEAHTPYLYSTYEEESEAPPTGKRKVVILGSGPIRIGQGIEFDYACVHACQALRKQGIETIMVNCNPETVSTDYDTSDRLYFEPLTLEDVLEITDRENPEGVIIQLGGQTPLKLARKLHDAGVKILGTSVDSIDKAEDRERFCELLNELGLKQAEGGIARSLEDGVRVAQRIGYPLMVRPSYVLGGRAMQKVHTEAELRNYLTTAVDINPEHPVLLDRFLEKAIEVDVDLVADQTGRILIGGLLEHVEEAGVHSGDAACVLPPYSLSAPVIRELKNQATRIAKALGVVGLQNVQFAVQGEEIYVLEVNPRASRTVPFISKAIGLPMARIASLAMTGMSMDAQGVREPEAVPGFAVKESVFPFNRFPGQDLLLGPEMKSTGEVMGVGQTLAGAFEKAQAGAGAKLPRSGGVLISVKDGDKPGALHIAKRLNALGYELYATRGTAAFLHDYGVGAVTVSGDGAARIATGDIRLVINTTLRQPGSQDPSSETYAIRRATLERGIPVYTTLRSGQLLIAALELLARSSGEAPIALQDRIQKSQVNS